MGERGRGGGEGGRGRLNKHLSRREVGGGVKARGGERRRGRGLVFRIEFPKGKGEKGLVFTLAL